MNEREIFEAAMPISDLAQQAEFLAQACSGDQEMQARLAELLDAQRRLGSFLELPAAGENYAPTVDQATITRVGDQVGPYKLLQEIGEGGMGTVWMAEQHEPVRRRVALKLIKAGMDSRHVLARFEAERQALSMMDHPNIARVLDAGATDSGRPYFVMELVKGQPITEYCDQQHLSPRERLELFLPVCHAIQHAHQKGIIHRDIKPSNVLVAEYDGRPMAKVIDFGVAKAVHQPLTERTMFTGLGQIIGTLEYMSPEQARVNQLDIDTRSDVYSLGVLLYELLTGSTPFDKKRMREAALDELLRIIREEEPPRPSTKLSSSATLPSIAANRRTEPARLSVLVRGELDWIVMKALEKDRNRRYDTANGFAMDIQRYLSDETVLACPPSKGYRFRKFARKNKALLASTALVSAALVIGLIGTTWQAIRATRAEKMALENRRHAVANAEKEAQQRRIAEEAVIVSKKETALSKAISDFLIDDLLNVQDPYVQLELGLQPDPEVRLRDLLDRGARLVEERFVDQPYLWDRILSLIAKAYFVIGKYQNAFELDQKLLQSRIDSHGPGDAMTIESMICLGNSADLTGRVEMAEELFESALRHGSQTLGKTHPQSLNALLHLAASYREHGRFTEAEPLFQQGLALYEEELGKDHLETVRFTNSLGVFYAETGRLENAQILFRDLVPRAQKLLGEDHLITLMAMQNLGRCSGELGNSSEELLWLERAVSGMQRVLGENHPVAINLLKNLSIAYLRLEDGSFRALQLIEQITNYHRAQLATNPASEAELAETLFAQTSCLLDSHDYTGAERAAREGMEHFANVDPNNMRHFFTQSMLGESLFRQDRLEEARQHLIRAYEGVRSIGDSIPVQVKPRVIQSLERLINFCEATQQPEEADAWRAELRKWTEQSPSSLGLDQDDVKDDVKDDSGSKAD